MNNNYINFFGFKKEPFPQVVQLKNLYSFPALEQMAERVEYAVDVGMVTVITGEVGSGKTTSLRYACSRFHPSKHKIIPITANTGSVVEILRQIALAFNIEYKSHSITLLTKNIKQAVNDIFSKKCVPVLVIDEAHLMREKIFFQLHTFLHFDFNAERIMPLILCGQKSLVNKLHYHTSEALKSRVVGRTMLKGLDIAQTTQYIHHHLKIAGAKNELYDKDALFAIYQGSSGIMRKANHLARGALLAATMKNSKLVSAEHVRLASSEIL